jgi:hypothetical protein
MYGLTKIVDVNITFALCLENVKCCMVIFAICSCDSSNVSKVSCSGMNENFTASRISFCSMVSIIMIM